MGGPHACLHAGRRIAGIVAIVELAVLGGCGSDGDEPEVEAGVEEPSTTSTSTSTSTTTTTSSTTTTSPTRDTVPPELVHEYHQVRRIGTPTEEMRVLNISADGTYDFSIEPLGYSETGMVVVTNGSIRFDAHGETEPELTFSGRGEARWTVDVAEYGDGTGTDLTLAFPDGRGYGYDGYDRGVDQYFVADD